MAIAGLAPHTAVSQLTLVSGPDGFAPASSRAALFQVNAIVGQVWLMQLRKNAQARYAHRSGPDRAPMQTGYAWRSFRTFFEPLSAIELVRLFENLLRFASLDACPTARAFFLAYAPLAFEHDYYREYIGPGVWSPPLGLNKAARRVRRTLQRWCDWLEALVHLQVHCELYPEAVQLELDKTIILLWPLAKRHNWDSRDLFSVLRLQKENAQVFPCESEQELAAYCRSALGLRASPATEGSVKVLDGRAVAERLLKLLPAIG